MTGPHDALPLAWAGAPLARARAGMVLVHGRGGTAAGMLDFAAGLGLTDVALVAPQAAGNTWYPQSFLAPLGLNQPGLDSGLAAIARALAALVAGGLAPERVVLMGFSQGACLMLEFAARHARRYGGIAALSGGLIGMGARAGAAAPDDKLFDYPGDLAGTPVYLGCSERDPHIPLARVQDSARVIGALGGAVEARIHPGGGHGITETDVSRLRGMLQGVIGTA